MLTYASILMQALLRVVDEALPRWNRYIDMILPSEDLLFHENLYRYLHNIPVVGVSMLAVAVTVVEYLAAAHLNQRAGLLLSAILELYGQGCRSSDWTLG
ncbi:hypothetical protein JT27_07210 [Alcaligenes faecalis]|uniref:hypothetical protein n=1 Tax=Alcaligenes faecalis TaxID=511 RepID=UPI00052BB182|nr:hypothetical protein [Alcaligenes faecalis]KGP02098.1 hypothetical protein JT27_07210 [Alcaligenes faecalis]